MCGIFGWQFKEPLRKEQASVLAEVLSVANDTRGGHSYGYWAPTIEPVKGLGALADHVPAAVLAQYRSLAAHTRYATTGEITIKNAHPFVIGPITGAHNGVIYNHYTLSSRYARTYAVDSAHIFAHLAEGRDLSELEGYGAIEYTDRREPGSIYLGLFQTGELAAARLTQGIVWSSDQEHLVRALRLAGFSSPTLYDIAPGKLYQAKRGVLYETGAKLPVSVKTRLWRWSETETATRCEWCGHPSVYGSYTGQDLCQTCSSYLIIEGEQNDAY